MFFLSPESTVRSLNQVPEGSRPHVTALHSRDRTHHPSTLKPEPTALTLKKKPVFLLTLALSVSFIAVGLPAQAERVCQVSDPTGTPPNVPDRPIGQAINSLRNGTEVYIEDTNTTYDTQGRPWVKVGG